MKYNVIKHKKLRRKKIVKIFKDKETKGITLIALVITIVVLLILSGISIATLTGENGLLTKASQSKVKTEEAGEKEGVGLAVAPSQIGSSGYEELNQTNLQNAIDSQFGTGKATVTDNGDGTFTVKFKDRWYTINSDGNVENSVNWDLAMANAKVPTNQTQSKNVIGIGTDGTPVNMDLWIYFLMDDGTYGLNTKENLETEASAGVTSGYKGSFNEDGSIVGTIPNSVVQMIETFYGCTNLNGILEINANITGAIIFGTYSDYDLIFENAVSGNGCKLKLTGPCKILEEIIANTNNPNITL